MDNDPRSPGAGQSGVPAPPDRIAGILSSFSDLRSNNRALLQELRVSIDQLRELRSTLRKRHETGGNGKSTTNLARFGLTKREEQVALLLAEGRSNQAIARELQISAHTARHHTQRVLSKLEVHSRGEAGAKIRSA